MVFLEDNSIYKNSLYHCVEYILHFYFGKIDQSTIASFANQKSEYFDVETALETMANLNLSVSQKDTPADTIEQHFFPSIIYNSTGDFLVLLDKDTHHAKVYDPNQDTVITLENKKLNTYSKAILIFRENRYIKDDKENNNSKSWFYRPLKSHWMAYVEIGILSIFINIFALAVPLFAMSVYDRVVPNQAFETLFVLAIGVIILLIFDLIFKSVRTHILEKVAKKIGLEWEELLMRKMLFVQERDDSHMTGSKANLFKELQQVRDFFAIRSITQIIDLPFFFVALLVIYLISPMVAIVPLIFAIIIIVFNLLMQFPISNLGKKHAKNSQNRYSFVVESIEGSENIKLNNAWASRMFDWKNIISVTDAVAMRIQSLNAFSMSMSQMVVQLVVVFVVIVGVFEISNQNLTVGGLIAVTILASRTMIPVVNFSSILIKFKEIIESVNRINSFIQLPSEDDKENDTGVGRLKGDIEFKNVTYSFKNSKYRSIENISFHIKPTEKIGIIGQTGAGKSTVLKLLTGLHTANDGAIYLDNHDISTIHPVEIRQNIGVMTQEPFLFNGTLKENIELSQPISKEKMMEIIKLTGLEELVKKSGKGENLEVGERGRNLSVGQRHLVALAQALVNDPSILILDEPTTGLDIGLEKKLIQHLKQTIKEKTMIVITHRYAALELVDRVIVLNEGKIVADGPRDAILKALFAPKGDKR